MAPGIGASGFVGIGIESVAGTYVAPTKYLLPRNETLNYNEDRVERRPLRGVADIVGYVAGNLRVEGNLEIEVTEDQLPYLLNIARGTLTKSGTNPNFTYTWVPTHVATPPKTASFTVVRNGVAFGYTGCIVSRMEWTHDNGILVATFGILGRDEANQSVPSQTPTTTVPFGAGQWSVEIPTATPVLDTDTFTLTIDDNADPQYRMKNTGRGMAYAKYGERSVTLRLERDFESRTDYDAYKALTAQGVTIAASKGANNSVTFLVPATVKNSYEISGLSGQGDLIRAGIDYMGTYDSGSSKSVQIAVKTQEDMTP